MSVIFSDKIRVEIDEVGSSLLSIQDNEGKEYLWQGDEKSWTGRDITIFPFVARLKDGYYTADGKRYDMPTHGFCRNHKFEIASKSDNEVVHTYTFDEHTLAVYPYKFKLEISHKVEGAKYTKTMKVTNLDGKEIYYCLGGHPAMSVILEDGDTKNNEIVFEREIKPNCYILDEAGHFILSKQSFPPTKSLSCSKEIMKEYATLILTDEVFDKLQLKRGDGVAFDFSFDNPPILAFWSHPDSGAYYCVEPWWGLPDFYEPIRDIKQKTFVQKLEIGKSKNYSFSLEIKK